MDPVFFTDAARAVHLTAMAAGFGLALFADALALKSLVSPIQRADIRVLGRIHVSIMIALAALWASGLILVQIRTGFQADAFSPKLIVKLGVVGLLTLNAILIGLVALPIYARHLGWRFSEIDLDTRVKLTAIAGLSMSCWFSALCLGVFSQLKSMTFDQLETIFITLFLVVLGVTMLMALMAPLFSRQLARVGFAFQRKDSPWSLPAYTRK